MRLWFIFSIVLGAQLLLAGLGIRLGVAGGIGLGILGYVLGTVVEALVRIAERR